MFKIKNIKWDTDGDKEAFTMLPTQFQFPNEMFEKWLPDSWSFEDYDNEEELLDDISDFLSDTFGFCHDGFEVEGVIFPKRNYMVTVTDQATYIIKAETKEEAIDKAWDYFQERKPEFDVEITDEEEDIEI